MGWLYDNNEEHEGRLVGFVAKSERHPSLLRELDYPEDDRDAEVARISAGCSCG